MPVVVIAELRLPSSKSVAVAPGSENDVAPSTETVASPEREISGVYKCSNFKELKFIPACELPKNPNFPLGKSSSIVVIVAPMLKA